MGLVTSKDAAGRVVLDGMPKDILDYKGRELRDTLDACLEKYMWTFTIGAPPRRRGARGWGAAQPPPRCSIAAASRPRLHCVRAPPSRTAPDGSIMCAAHAAGLVVALPICIKYKVRELLLHQAPGRTSSVPPLDSSRPLAPPQTQNPLVAAAVLSPLMDMAYGGWRPLLPIAASAGRRRAQCSTGSP
jgi:hypothetical protein